GGICRRQVRGWKRPLRAPPDRRRHTPTAPRNARPGPRGPTDSRAGPCRRPLPEAPLDGPVPAKLQAGENVAGPDGDAQRPSEGTRAEPGPHGPPEAPPTAPNPHQQTAPPHLCEELGAGAAPELLGRPLVQRADRPVGVLRLADGRKSLRHDPVFFGCDGEEAV